MEEDHATRKLAAVLALDVAGYSRLMGLDEEGTLRRLKAHLNELVEPCIASHRGRIVKRTGDGLLVDFASAVEAVRCAVSIQAGMETRSQAVPAEQQIALRIGINLGDVISDGDDIYGSGVNIAARLEALAEPGSIYISSTVRDFIRDMTDIALEDLGDRQLKNIALPVRVFRIGQAASRHDETVGVAATADKPSIAVLPFANMSGDVEQEYFSDGITEDLITDLSKVSGLFVIARNSSFSYKGRSVRVQDIGRDLDVRFVLEGSIRKAGNRVRITAQLIDAGSGGHLWAERFDRELTDIFATQDEVVEKIVSALAVNLTLGEQQRLRRRGTNSVEAYEIWLQARQMLGRGTRQGIEQAQALHRQAIQIDPGFAAPHAGLALAALATYINGWGTDPAHLLDEAERWARRALELDDQEPVSHMAAGNVLLWRRQHDQALISFDRMVALDPNFAQGHASRGLGLVYAGEAAAALEPFATAMRLDPHYPGMVLHFMALAHFGVGDYNAAAALLLERIARNPATDVSRMLLASCHGHLGRKADAQAVWEGLMKINPDFSVQQRAKVLPYKNARDFERIVQGLVKADLA